MEICYFWGKVEGLNRLFITAGCDSQDAIRKINGKFPECEELTFIMANRLPSQLSKNWIAGVYLIK